MRNPLQALFTVVLLAHLSAATQTLSAAPAVEPPAPGEYEAYHLTEDGEVYISLGSETDHDWMDYEWDYSSSRGTVHKDSTIYIERHKFPIVGLGPYRGAKGYTGGLGTFLIPLKEIQPYTFEKTHEMRAVEFTHDVEHISEYAFTGSIIHYMTYGKGGWDKSHVTKIPEIESLKVFDGIDLECFILAASEPEILRQFKEHPVWGQLPCIMSNMDLYRITKVDSDFKLNERISFFYDNNVLITYGEDSKRAVLDTGGILEPECYHCLSTVTCRVYPEEIDYTKPLVINGEELTMVYVARYVLVYAPTVSLKLPDSVTEIECRAFYKARKLSDIRLGRGLQRIGERAFEMCPELRRIESWAVVPPVFADEFAFAGTDKSLITLAVPDEALEAYRQAPVWRDLGLIIGLSEIYGSVSEAVADDNTSAPAIYDLGGRQVGTDTDNLDAGIYIKRDAEGTGKIVVR